MFLHPMLYEADKIGLIRNMTRFLDIAQARNIKAGFVFFDDCWNHSGAVLNQPCQPVPGRHNGCWMAGPQVL